MKFKISSRETTEQNNNVYGTIDNKNIRRNRIGQHFGEDNGSMVCRTKLLNQLGVTTPIESLHNLIEPSNLIGQSNGTKLNPQI